MTDKNKIVSYQFSSDVDLNSNQISNVALSENGYYLTIATNEHV